jgi:hypothetical protein
MTELHTDGDRGRPPKIDPMKPIHTAVMDRDVSTFSVEAAKGEDINRPGPKARHPFSSDRRQALARLRSAHLGRG